VWFLESLLTHRNNKHDCGGKRNMSSLEIKISLRRGFSYEFGDP
jgi:hypothetical protein